MSVSKRCMHMPHISESYKCSSKIRIQRKDTNTALKIQNICTQTSLIGWQKIRYHRAAHGIHQGFEEAQANGQIDLPVNKGKSSHQTARRVTQQRDECQPQNG